MDEIIVIRVADSDGSLFEAIIDALKNKRAEVIHVAAPFSSVLRVGDLEIYLDQQRVLMSGREVRLNHGEYAMLMHMVKSPGQVFSKRRYMPLHGTKNTGVIQLLLKIQFVDCVRNSRLNLDAVSILKQW